MIDVLDYLSIDLDDSINILDYLIVLMTLPVRIGLDRVLAVVVCVLYYMYRK